jgi:hypothetical protein
MVTFPTLTTGAIAQYPLTLSLDADVQVIQFVDGSGQRFTNQAKLLRRWRIEMNALDEAEIQALEAFFVELGGAYGNFAFPDPITGSLVPNCMLETAEMTSKYEGVDCSSTSIYIRETNG